MVNEKDAILPGGSVGAGTVASCCRSLLFLTQS